MKTNTLGITLLFAASIATGAPAMAQNIDRVEIGVLNCAVEGGSGFIFGSTKDLGCTFTAANQDRAKETYFGVISKYGLDIGATQKGVISWAVLAPTEDEHQPGALAGDYTGVSAEATAGVGLGANVLLGGSNETYALQPLSVTAQTGLNFALAVSQMQLRSVAD